jgi:hypothetical protein
MIHAVIVAGHAVLRNFEALESDGSWHLLDFQKGEPPFYLEHVRRGVEIAAADPASLLIFSGGQSRAAAGPVSEGFCYWWIAQHEGWFRATDVRERTLTEEFARDSFENLLLGICRFKEFVGRYPERVTVVSWAFKQERFGMHAAAIRLPGGRFAYSGPNNPVDLRQALAAETLARAKYAADPYSSGAEFAAKRKERNPFRRRHGYVESCPELSGLLHHAGPAAYSGPLPWAR